MTKRCLIIGDGNFSSFPLLFKRDNYSNDELEWIITTTSFQTEKKLQSTMEQVKRFNYFVAQQYKSIVW